MRPSTDDDVQVWLGIVSISALVALYGTVVFAHPEGFADEAARATAQSARTILPIVAVAPMLAGLALARRGAMVPGVATAAVGTLAAWFTATVPDAPLGLVAVVVFAPIVAAGVADATLARPGWVILAGAALAGVSIGAVVSLSAGVFIVWFAVAWWLVSRTPSLGRRAVRLIPPAGGPLDPALLVPVAINIAASFWMLSLVTRLFVFVGGAEAVADARAAQSVLPWPTLAIGLSGWLIAYRAGRWEALLAAGPGLATGVIGIIAEAANSPAFGVGIFGVPFGVAGSLCALLPVATAPRLLATPVVAAVAVIVWMIFGWLWFLAVLAVVGAIALVLRFFAWPRGETDSRGSWASPPERAGSD